MNPKPLTPAEVAALARGGIAPAELSPYSDDSCLVLRVDEPLPADEAARVAAWVRGLACPVVGIAGESGPIPHVAAACDVLVDADEAAAAVAAAVARNPVAATVLVQVLRTTERMPLEDALTVESLAYATLQAGEEYTRWLEANRVPAPFEPTDDGPAVVMTREDRSLRLELNRASNRNAMSVEMRDALVEALRLVEADGDIRSVEISGRGRCFSVGGDLTEFGTVPDPASGHIVRALSVPGRFLAACAERAEVRVHGACIGSGVEFPAFAGRLSAAANAHFQLPEVGMGLIPGAGGCVSLARRMGRQRLAWLALTGRRIRAERALTWGLVDAVT